MTLLWVKYWLRYFCGWCVSGPFWGVKFDYLFLSVYEMEKNKQVTTVELKVLLPEMENAYDNILSSLELENAHYNPRLN